MPIKLLPRSMSAFALISIAALSNNALSQGAPRVPLPYPELVARLPPTATYSLSPPSLGGRNVAFYKNPDAQSSTYFIAPMLLPDWAALKASIDKHCGAAESSGDVEVKVRLEFSRDSVRSEIAAIVSGLEKTEISPQKIFMLPYAWITVFTGANRIDAAPPGTQIPVRVIAEYPAGARSGLGSHALRITPPEPYLATIVAPCAELRSIYEHRNISGNFYAPFRETKLNSFSAVYAQLLEKDAFRSLMRKETQEGAQTVRSRSRGKGVGINIGGHFRARKSGADAQQDIIDSRVRTISANLIHDTAAAFSETILVRRWTEFGEPEVTPGRVADELLNFIKRNSTAVTADIKRIDDSNWKLVSGIEERSLTREQLKQLAESSSKLDIEFSEKVSIGCQEGGQSSNPYCGSANKKFKGVDDNGIKWNEEGGRWVPTSIQLYAVSTDSLSQAANASIVEVLASSGGMLTADLQPVATEVVPNDDLTAVIRKEIEAADSRIKNAINAAMSQLGTTEGGAEYGFDGMGAPEPGSGRTCGPGTYIAGIRTYMEDGHLKIVILCRHIAIPAVQ